MAVLTADCPHCGTNKVAFKVSTSYSGPGGRRVGLGQCGSCHLPLTFLAQTGAPLEQVHGDILAAHHILDMWPAIVELAAPTHTPTPIARRFIEGEDAYRRGNWNSAVAMYRSALDIATKAMPDVPSGLTFYKRLMWLHEHHFITQQMKDWADHVRVDGNDALHDPDEFEESDAKPLRLFTETFLRYVYELPGEVAAFRGETPPV